MSEMLAAGACGPADLFCIAFQPKNAAITSAIRITIPISQLPTLAMGVLRGEVYRLFISVEDVNHFPVFEPMNYRKIESRC
jgi:hypothetical protein